MLVLSRKQDQKILFPHLGIEVEVRRIAGNSVSIGINAPKSIRILRGELANASATDVSVGPNGHGNNETPQSELLHSMRNQLNKAQLAVSIAQRRLERGNPQDAEETLLEMFDRLTEIDQRIQPPKVSGKTRLPSVTQPQITQPHGAEKTRRALVVEDDANERALMAGYLELCGFKISEAADGIEAMEFLAKNKVDLVVLDMQMPRMNGRKTAEEIRRFSSLQDTKVVVVSGEQREEAMVTGDARGVSEWFAKPLDTIRFASYLDATLN